METGGGFSRRRMLKAEKKIDSPNLGDFLRVKEVSNSNGGGNNVAGLTLGAVLGREPRSTPAELPHRTLMDIIRDEPFVSKGNRKTWKHFTDKLCLRIPGSAWTSEDPATPSASDIPLQAPASELEHPSDGLVSPELTSTSDSTALIVLLQRSSSRAVDSGGSGFDVAEADGESRDTSGGELHGDQPARLSLMALLAETDREMSLDSSAGYMLEEEEGEAEEEMSAGGGKFIVDQCCVCMVRHKGAAFIPCGHTFCRRCSRELWVQRGSCPLCNNSISEVLDIF